MYSIKDGVTTSQKVTTAATASIGPLTHESRIPALMVQPGADRAIEGLTPHIEAILHTLYPNSEVAPFHNIKHAYETRDAALLLARRAQAHGHTVDLPAVEHAALLHDAHYQISPAMMGMPFREDVHMHYAYNTLRMLGAPDPHALRVARIILATNSMIEPQSIEEKIMRAADLSKLHGSYEGFREGSERLHREGNLLSYGQEPKDFSEFCRGQISYLALYLWPSLDLTPFAGGDRGQSTWHEGVLGNIFRLYGEEVVAGGAIVADLSAQPGAWGWKRLRDSNAIVVRVHEDQHSRESMLAQMRDVVTAASSPLIPFVVPGANERTPIPSGSCSLVCIDAAANDLVRAEAHRILAPSGNLIVS
jgi:predicted metal-dependent HD superfamily phosphohydrolase